MHKLMVEFLSQSPAGYVKMLKLKHAQHLLCNSLLSMDQVICVTGMRNFKGFVRDYEMALGETPLETRRQAGRLVQ
ncbi:MAG: helix-turn-helix domain-containing protein [Acidobacteriales bacterium]|nr:helix-turn-helix domain-containing protein [Terriglobales bacterium]